MRNLFNQTLGLILGLVIGVLSTTTALSVFFLWIYSTTDPKKAKPSYKRFSDLSKSEDYGKKEDPFKYVYTSRHELMDVINALEKIIALKGRATVVDLKNATNLNPTLGDHRWFWTNINGATITQKSDGFHLSLPDPEYI